MVETTKPDATPQVKYTERISSFRMSDPATTVIPRANDNTWLFEYPYSSGKHTEELDKATQNETSDNWHPDNWVLPDRIVDLPIEGLRVVMAERGLDANGLKLIDRLKHDINERNFWLTGRRRAYLTSRKDNQGRAVFTAKQREKIQLAMDFKQLEILPSLRSEIRLFMELFGVRLCFLAF